MWKSHFDISFHVEVTTFSIIKNNSSVILEWSLCEFIFVSQVPRREVYWPQRQLGGPQSLLGKPWRELRVL